MANHPSLPPSSNRSRFISACLAVLFTVVAGALNAQPSLVGSSAEGIAGVEVDVDFEWTAGGDAAAVQFDLVYDDTVLSVGSPSAGGAFADHSLDWSEVDLGRLRVTVVTPTPSTLGDGRLVRVPFQLADDAPEGTWPVEVEAVVISSRTATAVTPLEVVDGEVVVRAEVPVSPLAIPALGTWSLLLLAALLLAAGLRTMRGGGLLVLLCAVAVPLALATEAGAQPPPGDANDDAQVDAADIPVIVDQILERGLAPGDPDCNGDMAVDVLDTICAANSAANEPPRLELLTNLSTRERSIVSLSAPATDPDLPNDVLTWSLVQKPVGATIDPEFGTLQWVPTRGQVGPFEFRVRVTDRAGAWDEKTFVVDVRALGGPPVLADIDDQATVVGTPVAVDADATDPDLPGDTLTYSLSLAPAGMNIDGVTGEIEWTPGAGDLGLHDVTVQVVDQEGLVDFTSFLVTVAGVNDGPTANDDLYSVRFGETLQVPAEGVLSNDVDPNDDPLSAALVAPPVQGDLDLQPDGSFEYTPRTPRSRIEEDINLTLLAVPNVEASSVWYISNTLGGVDGDFGSTWRTDTGDTSAWYEQHFVRPVTVKEVRLYGNRGFSTDFTSGTFSFYDADGVAIGPRVDVDFDPVPPENYRDGIADVVAANGGVPLEGVSEVRFDATGYEGSTANHHSFSEMHVIGDGFVEVLRTADEWSTTWEDLPDATTQGHGAVLAAPTVGDLDADGLPEVVFTTSSLGQLVVVNGEDGTVEWTADGVQASSSVPALGDLDGDGMLEIVMSAANSWIRVYEHDGTLKTERRPGAELAPPGYGVGLSIGEGNFAIADLDGDGTPEIVVPDANTNHGMRIAAYRLVDDELELMAVSEFKGCGNNRYRTACNPIVADVDLDGQPEIVAGVAIYGFPIQQGTPVNLPSTFTLPMFTTEAFRADQVGLGGVNWGWNAIGNFDDDAFPEIVLVSPDGDSRSRGDVTVYEHDLTIAWGPVLLPDGMGGPPTVADFDNDGLPEIGVSGASFYSVFDTDGTLLWSSPTTDGSSNRTGSTVFDFQNDGSAEVVYSDERYLFVFRGIDGRVLYRTPMASITTIEYPIVADVDADGEAEIVSPAQRAYQTPGEDDRRIEGLHVIGSGPEDVWVRARPIWNQHSYHVTNVNADGTVPTEELPSWLVPGLNHYRTNDFLPNEAARADRFTYRANDGLFDSAPATVFIDLLPENTAPEIISRPDRTATVGFDYVHAVRATDVDFDPLTFGLPDGPTGMTIDPATGLLRWTPGSGDIGEHLVTVAVTDDDGVSAYQGFQLVVAEPQIVPEVVDQPQADAESTLLGLDFVLGDVDEANHPTIAAGRVSTQSPRAGTVAEFGATVDLVVSIGPGPEDIDDDGDGFTENEGDCDDADPLRNPGAVDTPADLVDQDCDGADADLPLVSIEVVVDEATLLEGERLDLTAYGIHADGTARIVDAVANWSVVGSAVSVGDGGVVLAETAGVATVQAMAEGQTGNAQITVVAHDPGDEDPPAVEITSPGDGETVFGPIDVIGIADDPNLVRYELLISPADQDQFTRIGGGDGPVSGVLGQFDPTQLPNDLFNLRLVALDAGGNEQVDEVVLQVDGSYKSGRFTVGFVDLEVVLGGLPIQIERVYDSLERWDRSDFGFGWSYRLNSYSITCTDTLGDGWQVLKSGLSFVLQPERPRLCTVRLPSGVTEEFALVPSPSASPVVPFSLLSVSFRPGPRATGSLRSLDNPNLLIADGQPGPVTLLDDTTIRTFDPRRFLYTTREGIEITLSTRTGVERVRDRNGNTLTFGPNGIVHSSGVEVSFVRDGLGRITSITAPDGVEQTYSYTASGDLLSHTDGEGNSTRFRHDRRHLLLDIDDPLGRTYFRNEYDESGRLVATTDAEGNRIELERDLGTRTEILRDFNGPTVMEYDLEGRVVARTNPLGERWELEYDAEGNLAVQRNPLGRELTRSFDSLRRKIEETDYEGNTREWEYNALGLVTREVDPEGHVTLQTYDSRGNLTSKLSGDGIETRYTYDGRGNRTSVTDHEGRTTRFVYDAQSRMVEEIDASGVTRTFSYDGNGRLLSESGPRTAADGSVEVLTYAFEYDANGRQTAVVDPAGNPTTIVYDEAGNEVSRTGPLGRALSYEHDGRNALSLVRYGDGSELNLSYDAIGRVLSRTDRDGRIRRFSYDALDRNTGIIEPGGAASARTFDEVGRLATSMDARGQVTRYHHGLNSQRVEDPLGFETEYRFDSGDLVLERIDALGNRTVQVRDAEGRLVESQLEDGTSVGIVRSSSGRPLEMVDQLGRSTRYEYDLLDRLIAVTDPLGGTTSYAHDEYDNLIAITDALGRTTRMEYDALGNLVRRVLPLGQVETFEYDAAGNLIRHVDANGDATTFEHDADGELVRKLFADGSAITFDHTPSGLRTQAGATTTTYDAAGRVAAVTNANGQLLTYGYDANGNVTSITSPYGVTAILYDELSRLERVTGAAGDTDYAYDPVGNLARMEYSNGTVTELDYDELHRLTEMRVSNSSGLLARYRYQHDDTGRRVQLEESGPATDERTVSYEYDAAGRLVTETIEAPGTALDEVRSYLLDAVGNRLQMNVDTALGLRTVEYEYDANDRLIRKSDTFDPTTALSPPSLAPEGSWERANRKRLLAPRRLAERMLTMPTAATFMVTLLLVPLVFPRTRREQAVRGLTAPPMVPGRNATAVVLVGLMVVPAGLVPISAHAQVPTPTSELAGPQGGEVRGAPVTVETVMTYDDNGALVRRESGGVVDRFSWNHAGRLVSAELRIGRPSPKNVSYDYDADGNRTAATVDGETTRFLVDTNRKLPVVLAEESGGQVVSYTHGHGPIGQTSSSGTDWYLVDGSLSIRQLSDSAGDVTARYSYDAFGVDLGSSGSAPNPFRYRGEQFDEDLQMYYLRARFYDQEDGVFLARDPAAGSVHDPLTFHRYLYAGADPVNKMDPTGRFFTTAEIGVIFALGVVIGFGFTYAVTEDVAFSLAVGLGVGAIIAGIAGGLTVLATAEAGANATAAVRALDLVQKMVNGIRVAAGRGLSNAAIIESAKGGLIAYLNRHFTARAACRVLRIMLRYSAIGASFSIPLSGGTALISPYYQKIITSAIDGAFLAMGC